MQPAGRQAARPGGAHGQGQGRVVHGGRQPLALHAADRRNLRRRPWPNCRLTEEETRCVTLFPHALVEAARHDPRVAAADRRPRLRPVRRIPPRLPRPVPQRRRGRAEHGRRRGRAGQGRLPAGRLRPQRLRAGARAGADQARRLLRIAAGHLHRRRRRRRLQQPGHEPPEHRRRRGAARRAAPGDPLAGRRRGNDGVHGAGPRGATARSTCAWARPTWASSMRTPPTLAMGPNCCPVRQGDGPLAWLATGSMVPTALAAARRLAGQRRLERAVHQAARRGARGRRLPAGIEVVVVLEEHSVYGGLGSAVAEIAVDARPDVGLPRRHPGPVLALLRQLRLPDARTPARRGSGHRAGARCSSPRSRSPCGLPLAAEVRLTGTA